MRTKTEAPPRSRGQVETDRINHVAELATRAFAEHRVEPMWFGLQYAPFALDGLPEPRAWLCSKPRGSEYHFTLYSVPGRLIVCGDMGALVLERTRDMLAWARGSIDSIDYFAGKVVSEIQTKEFDPEMARGWIYETDQDVLNGEHGDKFVKEWVGDLRAALLSAADGGEHAFREAYSNSSIYDGDPPSWDNWRHGFLWQREAIKWFLANHGA